ncbi:hypothetical protein C5167_011075 [Papaver somniferum]|uniref:DUF4378 domain-containing protein n=1 Tax=Papaver somniferum TaxID=3469 RepID=A0A4Y7K5W9_PAPSO|nr:uncharacterized protein LOC113286262 [Papaver somniferum]RZC67395.1 hypothetical protein C5167_011075 [Papaver somniferum]
MGGLFHLFDFSQSGTSRKSQKRLIDGLEAPRNSLELPSESSPRYRAIGDKITYLHQVNQKTSKQNISSNGAPMKKLINEEILKDSDSRRGVPSIVARLMGMDILPSETKPAIQVSEKKIKPKQERSPGKEHVASNPYLDKPLNSKSQTPYNLLPNSGEMDPDKSCHVFGNPRPREHPQEEQLQKFKKEFEAWQAATVWEQARVVEGSHKEKRTTYTGPRITRRQEKLTELNGHRPELPVKSSARERGDSYHRRYKSDDLDARNPKDFISTRNKCKTTSSFEPQTYCNTRDRKHSAATRIVVLKPGLDRSPGSEDSWARSSDGIEDEVSIEDFLEEVKEKLRSERRAKKAVKRDFIVIRNGVEFPFDAKPSSSKKIAQNIAKKVRECASRDFGMKLLRTESMKSYGSEIQVGESEESPEFISREMRKVLSKRLKNVLIGEIDASGITPNESRNSFSRDGFGSGKRSHWENMEDENEFQTNSRNGEQSYQLRSTGEMLPRSNLLRSMSAPVSSGTSFGKLLLEDRHVLTGAQLRRKHEVADNVPTELTRSSSTKDKFNLRGKFSSLNNFTLKSRLFGGKLELVDETESNNGPVFDRNAFTSGPTVMMSLGNTHENCTEVPPSPASVCSSVHEECCEPDESTSHVAAADASAMDEPAESTNLTSKTDVSAMEMDRSHSHHVFKVPGDELRPDESGLDQETATEEVKEEEQVVDDAAEMMVTEKACIKDLLRISGLYDGGGGGYESRLSAGADFKWVPLGICVFDKVEESRKANNSNKSDGESNTTLEQNHKVIFDLVNEALYTILEPCFTTTAVGPTRMPRGKRLLEKVWRMIGMYINPPEQTDDERRLSFYSLDAVVARDLGTNSWLDLNLDDSEDQLIGKEIGGSILDELIQETVRDAYGVSKLQS